MSSNLDLYAEPVTFYGWKDDKFGEQTSSREYVEVQRGIDFNVTVGDYFTHQEHRTADLYLDPATGLVVFDVEAYEKWLSRQS